MLPVPAHQINVLTLIMLNISGERTIQPETAETHNISEITFNNIEFF